MDVISQFLGRLHPLLVHLPIGFLILGGLLYFVNCKKGEHTALLSQIFLWTGIVATLACISGFLLYQNEGFSFDSVKGHLWFGIATALFCFVLYFRWKPQTTPLLQKTPLPLLMVTGLLLISITGHKGGNLTHGEAYLTEPLPNGMKKALGLPVFEEIPITINDSTYLKADLYAAVVHPIINNKCISCHGPKQDKGGLRLHTPENLMKGGENGEVIEGHNADKSDLYARLILPKENDDHMPPKDKEQLSKEEIAIIKTWIEAGHPFEGSIEKYNLDKRLFEPFFPKKENDIYPKNTTLSMVSLDSLKTSKDSGLHVEYLSKDSPWLRVTAINKPNFSLADTLVLRSLTEHIVDLDLANTQVNDSIYSFLRHLTNLTVLNLSHTAVSDKGVEQLTKLSNLKYLNLTGTQVTSCLLEKLEQFPFLQKVYLFGTSLSPDGPTSLKKGALTIDYGGYELPKVARDSIIF